MSLSAPARTRARSLIAPTSLRASTSLGGSTNLRGPTNLRAASSLLVATGLVAGSLVAGCSEPAVPADEQGLSALERLGKHLFEDTRLSEPAGQACASCHDAARGFANNDVVARGAHADRMGGRNVPTAMYASFSPPFAFVDGDDGPTPTGGLFWDGRANDLAAQAGGPLLNPLEMANASKADVVAKVAGGGYRELVHAALGTLDADPDLAFDQITVAIAAYESSARFHPFSSKFDASLRGDETLDDQEARGYALFVDPQKGNCIACHAGTVGSHEPRDWLFTDFTFDTLGLPRNAAIPANADPQFFDRGLCTRDVCDAFKVPTLRNVALTAPYGHNGAFATLREDVAFYATRDTDRTRWFAMGTFDDLPPGDESHVNTTEVPYDRKAGEAPRLDDDEIDAIVAFLETLTDR